MSNEDKEWLLNEFPQYLNKSLIRGVENHFMRAEMLLNGWDQIKKRSCSCQFRSLKEGVIRSYNKWLQNNNEGQISNK